MKPLIWPLFLYSSCAYVHHIQIDDRESFQKEHFEIKVSEIGVHLGETASILKVMSKSSSQHVRKAKEILTTIQMGPKTGNSVYSDK